jgi:hypothetical protein
MAVHEPMSIARVSAGDDKEELATEIELLQHVISNNLPTPVLGQSGFGKSHVIRWLDIHLRRQNPDNSWHVVRIPKNASLKQALIILLSGLDGESFEEARRKIDTVGQNLDTKVVAKHLIVFVSARLAELFRMAQEQRSAAQELGHTLPDEEKKQLATIIRHAKPNRLEALINDPFFNKQLIDEGRCFYQIAKRFTEGSTDQEIEESVYEVAPEDLELGAGLEARTDDLSLDARTYIRDMRLNTSEESREEAASLLNDCLNEACRDAFQQLFKFDSGSFQDLFQEIRASLNAAGKKLFILVEDMATISAIEDVLIDSLMQEDVRDGQQVLCPLHSAIAVTTGYHGYNRRRDTLVTRAKYEWKIGRTSGDAEQTYRRIENFCGRYLNASRHGEESVTASFQDGLIESDWPDVWLSGDKTDDDIAEVFGKSASGFPLFPFNKKAIRALANRYVKPRDTVEFNPRKILQHVLREPLENFRSAYENGHFPPPNFAGISCPGRIINDLESSLRSDKERAYAVAAIWGYGAQSLAELAHEMPPEIPRAFSLSSLADVLERTDPTAIRPAQVPGGDELPVPPKPQRQVPPGGLPNDESPAVEGEVDDYFEKRTIPQRVANEIRQALVSEIEGAQNDYGDWYGVSNWPKLRQRQPPIYVPFNPNNPGNCLLEFGSEREFSNPTSSIKYRRFVVAVIRRNKELSNDETTWKYPDGVQDYGYYRNFLADWLPNALTHLVDLSRSEAKESLLASLKETAVFVPRLSNAKSSEKIDAIVLTSDQIRKNVNLETGFDEWDQYLERLLQDWDGKQAAWLDAFSTNRHGIEGDLIRGAIRGNTDVGFPPAALRAAQKARDEFVRQHPELRLLQGCTSFEEFQEILRRLQELVSKLNSSQQFAKMEDVITAVRFKNKVGKVLEGEFWPNTKCALALQEPFSPVETILALHQYDFKKIELVAECLSIWNIYVERNLTRLHNDNAELGADKRKHIEDSFEELLGKVKRQVDAHRSGQDD